MNNGDLQIHFLVGVDVLLGLQEQEDDAEQDGERQPADQLLAVAILQADVREVHGH